MIQLIVGLGNPGQQYERTRHNAGFWFVEAIAKAFGGQFKPEQKFHGELCEVNIEGQRVRLLMPNTFMNRSGQSVAALARFYKIPVDEILVAHDELDFPAGKTRLKTGGGHGGHNGLRDIIAQTGEKNFHRLRIGIGHPGDSKAVTAYVLGRAMASEQQMIDDSIDEAVRVVPLLVQGEMAKATQRLHSQGNIA